MLSSTERSIRGRIGAHSLHAQGGTNTVPARRAFNAKFLHEVDPDGVLSEAERDKRAQSARKAHFAKLALKSSQARRKVGQHA